MIKPPCVGFQHHPDAVSPRHFSHGMAVGDVPTNATELRAPELRELELRELELRGLEPRGLELRGLELRELELRGSPFYVLGQAIARG